jgi:hypothetical protein
MGHPADAVPSALMGNGHGCIRTAQLAQATRFFRQITPQRPAVSPQLRGSLTRPDGNDEMAGIPDGSTMAANRSEKKSGSWRENSGLSTRWLIHANE